MSLTKGTRRSTFPTSMAVNGLEHSVKLQKFKDIGYEVVAENGYKAILAYYPYGGQYVKIVTVEEGVKRGSVQLTPKQLRALSDRVQVKKRA